MNYTAPKATLIGFEASEKLADITFDFDTLLQVGQNSQGGAGDAAVPSDGDININT